MKKSRKLLSLFLAVVMLASCFVVPITTSAATVAEAEKQAKPLMDQITTFESKFANGDFYTNMPDAYEAYVNANKVYDAYVYGGNTSVDLNGAASNLSSKISQMSVWTRPTNDKASAADGSYSKSILQNGDKMSNVLYTCGFSQGYTTNGGGSRGTTWIEAGCSFGPIVFLNDGTGDMACPVNGNMYRQTGFINEQRRVTSMAVTTADFSLRGYWYGVETGNSYKTNTGRKVAPYTYRTSDCPYINNTTQYWYSNTLFYNNKSSGDNTNGIGINWRWFCDGALPAQDRTFTAPSKVFVFDYRPVLNELNNKKSVLKSMANYREGGLKDFINNINSAINWNPYSTSYFPQTATTDENTIRGWIGNCQNARDNEIIPLIRNTNAGAADADGYENLRTAITNDIKGFDITKHYTASTVSAYNTAYSNAQSIFANVPSTGYNDAGNAQTKANELNTAFGNFAIEPNAVHEYGAAQTDSATCETDGKETKNCPVCNYTNETIINKLGHHYLHRDGKDNFECEHNSAHTAGDLSVYNTVNNIVKTLDTTAYTDSFKDIKSEFDGLTSKTYDIATEAAAKTAIETDIDTQITNMLTAINTENKDASKKQFTLTVIENGTVKIDKQPHSYGQVVTHDLSAYKDGYVTKCTINTVDENGNTTKKPTAVNLEDCDYILSFIMQENIVVDVTAVKKEDVKVKVVDYSGIVIGLFDTTADNIVISEDGKTLTINGIDIAPKNSPAYSFDNWEIVNNPDGTITVHQRGTRNQGSTIFKVSDNATINGVKEFTSKTINTELSLKTDSQSFKAWVKTVDGKNYYVSSYNAEETRYSSDESAVTYTAVDDSNFASMPADIQATINAKAPATYCTGYRVNEKQVLSAEITKYPKPAEGETDNNKYTIVEAGAVIAKGTDVIPEKGAAGCYSYPANSVDEYGTYTCSFNTSAAMTARSYVSYTEKVVVNGEEITVAKIAYGPVCKFAQA